MYWQPFGDDVAAPCQLRKPRSLHSPNGAKELISIHLSDESSCVLQVE
jgi:hypothetical protein